MKRLVKKSEYYNSIKQNDKIYDIYANPTDREITLVKKSGSCGGVRGIILNDGTVYIWSEDLLHSQVGSAVNSNDFRFSWSFDMDEWYIDCHKKYKLDEAKTIVKENKSILSRIGNINTTFSFTNLADISDSLLNSTDIF